MEALILFLVIFIPSFSAVSFGAVNAQADVISFSILRELSRTLTYTIPALALLWYIITDKKGLSAIEPGIPGKRDIRPFLTGFPLLVLIGIVVSFSVRALNEQRGLYQPPVIEGPGTIIGVFVMIFSSLSTGYLEESYFRYYLLTKLEKTLPNVVLRVLVSTFLFSICHIYDGPWGMINAAMAGILLSALFIRHRSLHGIAWAHAAYNVFVYTMGIFMS